MDRQEPGAGGVKPLNSATETREVIRVMVGELCIRGTYHRPQNGKSSQKRVGVLFVNHGFLPRSAPGDSAVHWAESLAKLGYPCFRVDLPGLGDSDGEVTTEWLDRVHAGEYAGTLSVIVNNLTRRFSLSGMVIAGHCAGAVTAMYAASRNKECRGLILTDPYFHLAHERTQIQMELRYWASWSRLGTLISDWYDQLRYLHLRMRGDKLPRNANLALLRCWHHLASARMPILILKAPVLKGRGLKPRMGDFDYLGHVERISGPGSRVVMQLIEGTNHSFANIVGREAVRREVDEWVKNFFPIAEAEQEAAAKSLTANSSG